MLGAAAVRPRRTDMLQPEPGGLLGQSASSFMCFIYTTQQSTLPFLLHYGARRCLGPSNKASGLKPPLHLGLLLQAAERIES